MKAPKINPAFRALIPPLAPEELSQLEANLVADGCRDPLVTWNGVLLDGHNRYDICTRLKIRFDTVSLDLADESAAMDWIDANQLGRRNLKPDQLSYIRGRLYNRTKKAHGGDRKSSGQTDHLKTAEAMASQLGVSEKTIRRDGKRAEALDKLAEEHPEEVKAVLDGKKKLNEVRRELKRQEYDKRVAEHKPKSLAKQGPFDLVMADPPWDYDFTSTKGRRVANHYETLNLDEICKLIPPTAANAVLLLWAVAPKLPEALSVMSAWGFDNKTCAVWDKEKVGMGYWFRGQHELLLVGTKGTFSPPQERDRVSSVFREARRGHSQKPECVYAWIERAFPLCSKVEMFCRKPRKGWASWGNEL